MAVYNFQGDYDNATAYIVNDTVKHNGYFYACILAVTGTPPTGLQTDNTNWAYIETPQIKVEDLDEKTTAVVNGDKILLGIDSEDGDKTKIIDALLFKGDKGDDGIQWQGEYDNTTAYVLDDGVSYNGSSYINIQAGTGNLPTDTSFWDILASSTETPESIIEKYGTIQTDPNGFDLRDNATKGIMEFCNVASSGSYHRIDQDSVFSDITGATTFGDGVTPLADNTFIIRPVVNGGTFDYWTAGKKIEESNTLSILVDGAIITAQIISIDRLTGLLKFSTSVASAITEDVIVAVGTFSPTDGDVIVFGDERHGKEMSSITHLMNHSTTGVRYGSGLDWIGLSDGSPTYTQFDSGVIWDEDIQNNIIVSTENPFWYKDGTNGEWRKITKDNQLGYKDGGVDVVWNEFTGTTWQLTPSDGSTDYMIGFAWGTNNAEDKIAKTIPQGAYSSRSKARDAIETELGRITLDGLPSPEFTALYAYIVRRNGDLENWDDNNLVLDLRLFGKGGASGGTDTSDFQLNTSVNLKTADYTFTGSEIRNGGYGFDTTSGNLTATIDPSLFTIGTEISFAKLSSDANTLIIDASVGNTIDGNQTYTITDQWETAVVVIMSSTEIKIKSSHKIAEGGGLTNWDIGTTYSKLELAINNGGIYKSTTDSNTGNEPHTLSSGLPALNINYTKGGELSVATEDLTISSGAFSADGMVLFMNGQSNDKIFQYDLSVPFDLNTAKYSGNSIGLTDGDVNPLGIYLTENGLHFYVVERGGVNVVQFTMSTANDLSTATEVGIWATSPTANMACITMKPDGTKFWLINSSDVILEYTMSTAYDITTTVATGNSLSVTTQESTPAGLSVSNDGTRMLVCGGGSDKIHQYNLTTAWDLSTASYSSLFLSIFGITGTASGFFSTPDFEHMIIGDATNEKVFGLEYIDENWAKITS